MNKQHFNLRNNIGKVITFQKSGSTNSFDPTITFSYGTRRVSWRLNNGTDTTQVAGNNIVYTGFTSDVGVRTIEMRGNSFKNIDTFNLSNDNLYGSLDLTKIEDLGGQFLLVNNPNLTGITHSPSSNNFTTYQVSGCGLIGNIDVSMLKLGGTFYAYLNPNLTGVTHGSSTNTIIDYQVSNCNIIGNLDVSPLSGLSQSFKVYSNPNLTGITHAPSSNDFTSYQAYSCGLIGNLDLTPLSGLGGQFWVSNSPNLTGITHSPSSNNMNTYQVTNCGIIGNHDLTMFPNLGSSFNMSSNLFLTGITHTYSSRIFSIYNVIGSNLTGNHNLSMFPNLGGSLNFNQNTLLTGITHTASTINILNYIAVGCNLIGTLDLSMLNLGVTGSTSGFISLQSNPNLNNVIFPNVSNIFRNNSNSISNYAFVLKQCNFDYVDFKPLSGSTLLSGASIGLPAIELQDNNMNAGDVNHILDDFKTMVINNPSGWSNIRLFIGGTNSDPDSSSGGFNGISAISTLTGSPYNWTITY
jgi:hypothetical protein